jgi:hypothetical protein
MVSTLIIRPFRLLCIVLSASLLSGCFLNFYKASAVKSEQYGSALKDAMQSNRYFIFHQGEKVYGVRDIKVNEASQQISLTIDSLPADHKKYAFGDKRKTYKKNKKDSALLTEIHLYSNDNAELKAGTAYTISVSQLSKLEIIQHDKGKTTGNHVLSIVGVTLGAFGLILIIALLTKSSCPFVSGYIENEFRLQGEIFGGAIYPQLQRDDYLPLSLQPVNNELVIKISNELLERQYTDMAELWCIDHDPSVKIVQDEKGALYSVSKAVSPKIATAGDINLAKQLAMPDNQYFDFSNMNDQSASEMNISFDCPEKTTSGVLLLRLKNSYWLDLTYGELMKNFGSHFDKWNQQQKNRSAQDINKWKQEQMLPLKIEMRTDEGWQHVASLEAVGPVAFRDLAVPLKLDKIKGSAVELRLSSGFMFWELDQAAISYDEQLPFIVNKQKPIKAYDEKGTDVQQQLMTMEKSYLYQPVPGNVATIHFKAPALKSGKGRSYILHASGYYEHVRNFTGSPNIKELKKFREAGALSRLSYTRYRQALAGLNN